MIGSSRSSRRRSAGKAIGRALAGAKVEAQPTDHRPALERHDAEGEVKKFSPLLLLDNAASRCPVGTRSGAPPRAGRRVSSHRAREARAADRRSRAHLGFPASSSPTSSSTRAPRSTPRSRAAPCPGSSRTRSPGPRATDASASHGNSAGPRSATRPRWSRDGGRHPLGLGRARARVQLPIPARTSRLPARHGGQEARRQQVQHRLAPRRRAFFEAGTRRPSRS